MIDIDQGVVFVIGLYTLVTYAILDQSLGIVISLDILIKYVILCMVKMLMLLSLTAQVINMCSYLRRNIISIFNINQVSKYIYQRPQLHILLPLAHGLWTLVLMIIYLVIN